MMHWRSSHKIYLLALVVLLSGGGFARWFAPFAGNNMIYRATAERITLYLMKGLVFEHHLPCDKDGPLTDTIPVVYILGGMQDSIRYKCKTVGRLYAGGTARNILFLHRPGITEYSHALGRNITNDEWSAIKLKEEGVAIENLEFISVPPATFNTFAEARGISALVRSRKVKRLVLVSSMHHTKRVWLSFSHFNADNSFELYSYGSEERAGIFELLMESMKLRFYRYFVFPLDRLREHFRR